MREPSIQTLAPAEWRRGRALRLRALRESPDAFSATLEEERLLPEAEWRRRLERPDATTLVALTPAGRDVGLIVGAPYGQCAGLYSLWITPAWRRRGIGRRLVDGIVAWARDKGQTMLLLDVGDWNLPAIRLYGSKGFQPTGRVGTLPPPRERVTEHQRALIL